MSQSRVPRGVPTGGQFAASVRAESTTDLEPVTGQADQADRPVQPGYQALKQAMEEWRQDNPRHPLARNEAAVNERAAQIQEALNAGAPVPDAAWADPQGERSPEQQHYIDTMRNHGILVAAQEAGVRIEAGTAILRYEAARATGGDDDTVVSLRDAAVGLEPFLPRDRGAAVHRARVLLDAMLVPGPGSPAGAADRLHSEVVDALSDAPTRSEVESLRARVEEAKAVATAAVVDNEMGVRTRAEADEATFRRKAAQAALSDAERERHEATRERITQERPTLYDMWETQDRAYHAQRARRRAVNAADSARVFYRTTAADHPDVDRRRRAADEATRREVEAQEEHDFAHADLERTNQGWRRMRGDSG